ncbi:MAG: hypothetical protein MMC33_005128 [Icmadophila ericetorum]|nr:hypothetical protein [Icmadophila ericetorum]
MFRRGRSDGNSLGYGSEIIVVQVVMDAIEETIVDVCCVTGPTVEELVNGGTTELGYGVEDPVLLNPDDALLVFMDVPVPVVEEFWEMKGAVLEEFV